MEHLALAEAPSSHPLASALVQAARDKGVSSTKRKNVAVKDHTILKGEGIVASVGGRTVHVGNRRLFERLGIYGRLSDAEKETAEGWAAAGDTVGFMSIEGSGIVCMYSVADAIRDEARTVVRRLKELGIEVSMITGDGKDAAMAVADQVGLSPDQVHSQLLPEDKLKIISAMRGDDADDDRHHQSLFQGRRRACRGNVLLCGDGGKCYCLEYLVIHLDPTTV